MSVEKEIELIKERNKKVEADKAWETSWTRKILITFLTYFMMIIVMKVLGLERPFIGAIIPTLGFMLSTISANLVKSLWLKKFYGK
ncbi:MAG: hypothetical protein LBR70_02590 [Lactobacillaceae bacterium]|jgi:hypothetical protein|nr:hypothetical protein [Lactobacillaceae bacterium]